MALVGIVVLALTGQQCAAGSEQEAVTTPNGSRLVLPERAEPVAFPLTTVRLLTETDTFRVLAEVARTDAQRERGLMFRTFMPDTAGMLFLYDAPREGGFWMLDTPLPLSVALADSAGVILEILEMAPCVDEFSWECPVYEGTEPFQYALEMNRGYFAERGIGPGAVIEWAER